MFSADPAPAMPALVTVTVFVALVDPTSWSAKARSPLWANAGTGPAKSLPSRAKVVDCTPPAGRPGPSTRKRFVPNGLPTTAGSVTAVAMNPAGGAGAPGAGVRNGPKRPASASAKLHTPVVAT